MQNYRFVNLRQSGESKSDAATVGIVLDWIGALNNAKVDWGGGTMTGHLIIGGNKLRDVGDPEDDQDVVNKRYFMNVLLQTKPYELGGYIVFPNTDNTKSFFTSGKRKGIYLDSDKAFEIFNGNVHGRESNYDIG